MLQQHLLSAAVSTCLTSPLLHAALRDVLIDSTGLSNENARREFHLECQRILRDALDREEPRRFRLVDINEVLKVLWPDTMFRQSGAGAIPFFDALSAHLFTRTRGIVHFRAEALEEFARLSARIDPALLLCWRIGRDIASPTLPTRKHVRRAIEQVQPFCAPKARPPHRYTDNHVHLSGASSEQLILMAALRGSKAGSDQGGGPLADKLRTIAALGRALLLSKDELSGESEHEITQLSGRALTAWGLSSPVPRFDWATLRKSINPDTAAWPAWIKFMLALSMEQQDLARAWLWLLLWCCVVYQHPECGPKRRIALFLLLGTIMRVRQDALVEGYGLNRFLKASATRDKSEAPPQALQKDAARRIFHGRRDRAEVKVPPTMLDETAVRGWLDSVMQAHPAAHGGTADACAGWHFSVHFSRGESSPWTDSNKIEKALTSLNVWDATRSVPGSTGVRATLEKALLIRTVDIAGDENKAKTEVFAPAVRWLRSLPRPAGARPLALSIHAGEDYAHPLSGMRHVDETVVFCEMRPDDRIGHGLALGIAPDRWFRDQGQALVSMEEHVDNLVWAWHFAAIHPALPHAAQVAALYTSVVRSLLPFVSWLNAPLRLPRPSMQTLYEAWGMRRNCRNLAPNPKVQSERMRCAVPDRELLLGQSTAPEHVRIFQQKLAWFDPNRRKKLLEKASPDYLVQITASDRNTLQLPRRQEALALFSAVVTPFELTFMEALQDLLIERYRKRGLVFEANPTSNRHIGALDNLKDHPIFRWDPPDRALLVPGAAMNRFALREGPLRVCVNTDDPGIMPTTLRTEFELLRHAARDHGVPLDQVNAWLDHLRDQGNRIFDECRAPPGAVPGAA